MTDDGKMTPVSDNQTPETPDSAPADVQATAAPAETQPPAAATPPRQPPLPPLPPLPDEEEQVEEQGARISRLSGEPAPDISPEEFARLQRGGGLNLDSRGRVRVGRDRADDPGVALRKRRAWYG